MICDEVGENAGAGLDTDEIREAGFLTALFAWRGRKGAGLLVPAVVMACLLGATVAEAQQDRRTTTVTGRLRPETDPIGLNVGGLMVLPSVTVSESYDDNIFAFNAGEINDLITNIEPEIVVRSDWNRHSLKIVAEADVGLHNDNDGEDYEDARFSGRFRIDVTGDTYFTGDASYTMDHGERGSPDDADGIEPN